MSIDQERKDRIERLIKSLPDLTGGQLRWIESIVEQFSQPSAFTRDSESDLITPCMLQDFGDALRIHHCFSVEPFRKDRFEYVLQRVTTLCDKEAELAPAGNPGYDMIIDDERFSLKTQADKGIRVEELYISKFMELGQGKWDDDPADLIGLREQFLTHLKSYDRILSLRTLQRGPEQWRYELVEIPKPLLREARQGRLEMRLKSTQMPKPGYCYVSGSEGDKFQLYFDGGTERKLQIKHLKKAYCIVHAEWIFTTKGL